MEEPARETAPTPRKAELYNIYQYPTWGMTGPKKIWELLLGRISRIRGQKNKNSAVGTANGLGFSPKTHFFFFCQNRADQQPTEEETTKGPEHPTPINMQMGHYKPDPGTSGTTFPSMPGRATTESTILRRRRQRRGTEPPKKTLNGRIRMGVKKKDPVKGQVNQTLPDVLWKDSVPQPSMASERHRSGHSPAKSIDRIQSCTKNEGR